MLSDPELALSVTPVHTDYNLLSRASSFKKLRTSGYSKPQVTGNKQDINKLVIIVSTLYGFIQRQKSSKTTVRELAESCYRNGGGEKRLWDSTCL